MSICVFHAARLVDALETGCAECEGRILGRAFKILEVRCIFRGFTSWHPVVLMS